MRAAGAITILLVLLAGGAAESAEPDCYAYYAPITRIGVAGVVELECCTTLQGWALGLCFEPDELMLDGTGTDETTTETVNNGEPADFISLQEYENGVTIGVVVDFMNEFELPIGLWDIVWIRFQPGPVFLGRADLTFCDTLGDPSVETFVVYQGMSIVPEQYGGLVCDEACEAPPDCARFSLRDGGEGWAEVFLTCLDSVSAFSLGVCHADPSARIVGYSLAGTATEEALGEVEPEFLGFSIHDREEGGGCTLEVVLDTDGHAAIPRGALSPVVCLLCEPIPGREVPTELPLAFCEELGSPPVPLSVTIRGGTVCNSEQGLDVQDGSVAIPVRFKRGDANGDGRADIGDVVAILEYLFFSLGPRCVEAFDANDDATIDVSDPIALLDYLFVGDVEIPAPGPILCGFDPTPDALGCGIYDICN